MRPLLTAAWTIGSIAVLTGCALTVSAIIMNLRTPNSADVSIGICLIVFGVVFRALILNNRVKRLNRRTKELLLCAAAVLCAAPAYAGQTEIAFETIVTLDKFRITNQSTIAHLNRIYLRPSAEPTLTVSDPEMLLADTPPWPGDDRVGWFVNRWYPGRWVEFSGTIDPSSTLDVEFVEPTPKQERGYIFAPVESGTFTGFTVPEPSTIIMAFVGVLSVVVYRRRLWRR